MIPATHTTDARTTRSLRGEGAGVYILLALAGAALIFFALPVAGLLLRTPWRDLPALLTSQQALSALRISVIVSVSAAGLTVLLGTPLAWALAHSGLPFRNVCRALVALPMVMPPVVGGVALLSAFGRRGLLGEPLTSLGLPLPFTLAGAIVAATFVASPFFVLTVEAALRSRGSRLEDAAATLGASRLMILRTVTLPAIAPSLLAGLGLTWARALGEFGATITFNGNLPGVTQTLPLAVYQAQETSQDAAVALSLVLIAISLLTLLALRGKALGS